MARQSVLRLVRPISSAAALVPAGAPSFQSSSESYISVGEDQFVPGGFFDLLFQSEAKNPEYEKFADPLSPGDAMADMTREEIDAKLATVEARAETRFTELSGKMDRVMDSITAVGARVAEEISFVKSELSDVKADNKWTRWTIIIALVTSIIAGIGALWVTQSNLLSAFQTGLLLKSEAPATSVPRAPNTRQ